MDEKFSSVVIAAVETGDSGGRPPKHLASVRVRAVDDSVPRRGRRVDGRWR